MSKLDSFGKVFYPNQEKDIIYGARLFSDNNETILEFDTPTFNVPRRPDIILGEFTGIGPVTCMDNEIHGVQSGEGGTRCKYKVSYLFTGFHFTCKKDVCFNAAIFQMNSLVEWFEIKTITHDLFPIKTIELGKPVRIELKIKGFRESCFYFTHDVNSKKHSIEAYEHLVLKLQSSKTYNLEQFNKVIIKLKKLFAFLAKSTLEIDDISLYRIENKTTSPKKEESLVKIKLIEKNQAISPMPTSEFLNIKYIDIQEYFPSLLSKWLKLSDDNLVIDLLMEKAYNRELSDKTYFLNICFALEIYHKTNINDQKLTSEEFNEIKGYFRKNIKNKAAKDWIDSKLGFGNYPSFRDRLVHFKNEFGKIYYTDVETLINRIIQTRNSLVHSTSKSEYTITDELELFLIAVTIETVVKGAILKKLGVKQEDISKIYEQTKKYIDILLKRRKSELLF